MSTDTPLDLFWFLPTPGDGRYLGTRQGHRPPDFGYLREVARILVEFGWEPEDVGRMESARALEPLCQLWCLPGFLRNEWNHAFKLLKR